MDRRSFILGLMGSAALATLPIPAEKPFPHGWKIVEEIIEPGQFGIDIGDRYAKALAHSMMQTKEQVGARLYSKVFKMGYSITRAEMYID